MGASGQSLLTLSYCLNLLCEIITFRSILKCQRMRKALNIYKCGDSLAGYLKREKHKMKRCGKRLPLCSLNRKCASRQLQWQFLGLPGSTFFGHLLSANQEHKPGTCAEGLKCSSLQILSMSSSLLLVLTLSHCFKIFRRSRLVKNLDYLADPEASACREVESFKSETQSHRNLRGPWPGKLEQTRCGHRK